MNAPFKILDEKLFVSWNIDNILKQFAPDVKLETKGRQRPYHDPSGKPHWQIFPSNISFARNFPRNFPDESKEVIEKLKEIQSKYKFTQIDSQLLHAFLNTDLQPGCVTLTRTESHVDVDLHVDVTRNIAINIGLKNSNTHETFVSHVFELNKFENSDKSSCILDDGNICLLDVTHPHMLKSRNKNLSIPPRYIISYVLILDK